MKRCPTCNQEFTDEWLTFCTQDGTSLVEVAASATEPPPTLWHPPPMPPSVSPTEQPTLDMPGTYRPPPAPFSQPQPLQSGWTPPPPPAYPAAPQQSLAIASLVLGIVSVTVGWCCSFGILTAPIALILGIVSLVQVKNEPSKYGGKGLAIGGIVTGSLYLAIVAAIILLYGIGILMSGFR
ncbi:MAG TPA: DUF4190 domain-containing protein [Pyrinomonadaceae bacterium]|jgi:hypothetical protein